MSVGGLAHVGTAALRGRGSLGTGVTDRCEPSDVVIGIQTQGS